MDYLETGILSSIKKRLGVYEEDSAFDADIVMGINSAFSTLTQLGVGPVDGFRIHDITEQWDDYLENRKDLEFVKDYVYLKTKLVFDPPANSFAVEAIKSQLDELTFRINVAAEQK